MNKRPFLLTTLTLFLSFDAAASAQTSDLLEAGLESHLPAAAPRGWSIGNLGLDDHTEADKWDDHRPDSHAPIGVMGDHTHRAGEWMLSYRYMSMDMDGNRDGTSSLSTSDVFAEGFPIVPTEMTMEMHMFGGMYAPTDHLTLTAMVPYIRMEMDHERPGIGDSFSTESDGLGDVRLGGLYKVYDEDRQRVHLNFAVSLPTGSTDEEDATPMGPNTKLPYPMQLGSGTWDLLPGVTYLGQSDSWSWGAQTIATFRLGENDEDYTLGDRLAASVWGARLWNDALSSSLRLGFDSWKNIRGRDEDLPMGGPAGFPAPTMDPDRRAGNRLDLGIGTNWYGREGWAKGHRLAIEVAFPLYQDLDGPVGDGLGADDRVAEGVLRGEGVSFLRGRGHPGPEGRHRSHKPPPAAQGGPHQKPRGCPFSRNNCCLANRRQGSGEAESTRRTACAARRSSPP